MHLFAAQNLVKLDEEFESDEPESRSLLSIILWVLLGVLLPSLIKRLLLVVLGRDKRLLF